MLDVGHGVRLILAAAPSPPVPAPPAPGKPPFALSSSSSSSVRCCYSSWWFSNGNAHGRNTTTATSSRATRRRWWSDPDGSQEDYGSSRLEEDDYGDEDEAAFSGFGWAGELFDDSWFSKVFKVYGFTLPVMLTSMFAATGLKAFLMAMAIPLSQSAISYLLRRRKGNRVDRRRRPFQERRRRHNYQSWVSKDNTMSSSSGDSWGGNKSSGRYGGWDELLDNNTAAAQVKRSSSSSRPATHSNSQLATLITARNRGLKRLGRKMRVITAVAGVGRVEQGVGAPPETMRMRRRRMPRTMALGSTRYKQAPPLMMRLLVAIFPFLGSWFRLL